jgi:hypothetical protein
MALSLLFGVNLTFTELGNFMAISTGGHAAPLTPMILGGVVKIEHAGGGIGAPVKITQVSFSQEDSDLATEKNEGKFLSLKLRAGTDEAIARPLLTTQFFVKNVFRQQTIDSLQKLVAHLLAGHQSSQFRCPILPELYHTSKFFCATRGGQYQAPILRQSGQGKPVDHIRPCVQMLCPLSVRSRKGVGKVDRGVSTNKNKFRVAGPDLFSGRIHGRSVTYKILFDKLL